MKRLLAFCSFVLICALLVGGAEAAQFRGQFIRLHILANSDSAADQEIKLALRDALLEKYGETLFDAGDRERAEEKLREKLGEIEAFCAAKTAELGAPTAVSVCYGEEYYERRVYRSISLPAGRYSSLRIVLGEGKGQNWWCVLFPPLCLGAASGAEEEQAYLDAGFSPETYSVVSNGRSGKYKIRFRLFEWFGKLFS
ncbi:MAG: stage II sporulation protein R [Clostridia bacterium]|nr:stage II sporulation protein R [Clostridia bacterium]